MLKVKYSSRFKKGLRLAVKRDLGQYKGYRECHIQPDWLLIYLIEDDILTLTLVDTGTHSDLFRE